MQLSREFVEKLSQIFFTDEIQSDSMDNTLSDFFSKTAVHTFNQENTKR
jgi:hypothetical protein